MRHKKGDERNISSHATSVPKPGSLHLSVASSIYSKSTKTGLGTWARKPSGKEGDMEAQGGCSGVPGSFRLRDLKQKQPEVTALTK